jgi:hypothetical protein
VSVFIVRYLYSGGDCVYLVGKVSGAGLCFDLVLTLGIGILFVLMCDVRCYIVFFRPLFIFLNLLLPNPLLF